MQSSQRWPSALPTQQKKTKADVSTKLEGRLGRLASPKKTPRLQGRELSRGHPHDGRGVTRMHTVQGHGTSQRGLKVFVWLGGRKKITHIMEQTKDATHYPSKQTSSFAQWGQTQDRHTHHPTPYTDGNKDKQHITQLVGLMCQRKRLTHLSIHLASTCTYGPTPTTHNPIRTPNLVRNTYLMRVVSRE